MAGILPTPNTPLSSLLVGSKCYFVIYSGSTNEIISVMGLNFKIIRVPFH